MAGFNASSVTILLGRARRDPARLRPHLFFRVPPLRQRSALQEQADAAGAKRNADDDRLSAEDELEAAAVLAAAERGPSTGPMTGSTPTQPPARRR